MQTSIELQALYNYSLWPLVIFFSIFIIMTTVIITNVIKRKKSAKHKQSSVVIPEKNEKNIPVIKNKYIEQLNDIEKDYKNEKITLRMAYQRISETVRFFVFEVTDISTQNFSLAEIKKTAIPGLYEVIEEYYEPEFASKSIGDFDDAINKARRIVNEWN